MRRCVLLAWETGSGLGHLMTLKRVAARLRSSDLRLVAAVKDIVAAQVLAGDGIEVLQAPLWPRSLAGYAERGPAASSASMGDILAGMGLGTTDVLRPILAAWGRLLALVKPDLIIGDLAPGASLAARGRVPLALASTSYGLPPAQMRRFPLFLPDRSPAWPEEQIVETVNDALRAGSAPPLDRLPQVFEAQARYVATFPVLDVYRQQRPRPADGPLLDRLPRPRDATARSIFVYLSASAPLPPAHVIEALGRLAPRLRVFGPGLSEAQRSGLASRGAFVSTQPLALPDELGRNCLAVHNGNAGLCAEAMLAGVPQLALSVDIEKDLNGAALEREGVGRLVRIYDPAERLSAARIEALADDAAISARAIEAAAACRALMRDDPLGGFAGACAGLMT